MRSAFRKLFVTLMTGALLLAACSHNAASLAPAVAPSPVPTSLPLPQAVTSLPVVRATAVLLSPPAATPGSARSATPTSAAPRPRSAEIQEIKGNADKRDGEQAPWTSAALGDALSLGKQVRTDTTSTAALRFTEGTLVRLAPGSIFTVVEVSGDTRNPITRLKLQLGKIFAMLAGSTGKGSFEIDTPSGVASVRGSLMSVEVNAKGRLVVTCLESKLGCHLQNSKGGVDLKPGQEGEIVDETQPPSPPAIIDAAEYKDWYANNPEIKDTNGDGTPDVIAICPAGEAPDGSCLLLGVVETSSSDTTQPAPEAAETLAAGGNCSDTFGALGQGLCPANGTEIVPTEVLGTPAAVATEMPNAIETAAALIRVPTKLPTQAPIELPTQAPIELPTQAPVELPTQVPVELPTQVPVEPPVDVQPPPSIPSRPTLP